MPTLLRQSSHCILSILLAAISIQAAAADTASSVQCTLSVYPNNGACVGTPDPEAANTLNFLGEFTGNNDPASATVFGFVRSGYGNTGIDLIAKGTSSATNSPSINAYAQARWNETLEVVDSTKLFGTPVQLIATHRVTADLNATPNSFTPVRNLSTLSFDALLTVGWGRPSSNTGGFWADLNQVYGTNGDYFWERSAFIDTYVGALIGASYMMNASISLSAGAGTGTGEVFANVEAGNSGHVYFDALDSTVTLVSRSGHDYASPTAVPESSTYALMAAGLGILAFVTRSRRRQHVSHRSRCVDAGR